MAGIAGLLAGGSGLLAWVVNGADLPQGIVIRSVALAVLMSLAGNIVLLPLTFRFDQNKARVAYILFICAMAGFMGVFMGSTVLASCHAEPGHHGGGCGGCGGAGALPALLAGGGGLVSPARKVTDI